MSLATGCYVMNTFYGQDGLSHNHTDELPEYSRKSRSKKPLELDPPFSAGPPVVVDEVKEVRRKRVATFDDIEFTQPSTYVPRNNKNSLANTYTKNKSKKKNLTDMLAKYLWVALAILVLRLVFMKRGVLDYYQMAQRLDHLSYQAKQAEEENHALIEEIKQIKNSKSYQKRIVRDHLGVIDTDEYLVLFAQENKDPSK
ncbi:MAG: septum formation initiator family protein [Bacteriovoracaceae bacterium]|nr:septum formation initiator family protein [Bacteriovoracaceae bacterium]